MVKYLRNEKFLRLYMENGENQYRWAMHIEIDTNHIRPKPRMVQSDRYKKRRVCVVYNKWKDEIVSAYNKVSNKKIYVCPVALSFEFLLKNQRKVDLDNLVKGVIDSLTGYAWIDDSIKWIPKFDKVFARKWDEKFERVVLDIRPLHT